MRETLAMIRRLVMFCLSLAAVAAFAATPVAFVTDVQGGATIAGNGKVTLLGELAPATQLVLEKGAKVAVMYAASGAEFTLGGPGEFLIDATEAKALKGAAPPARRNVARLADPAVVARVSQSATASLRMRSVGAPAAAKAGPAYPRNTQVATLQPTLRWGGDPGAKGFAVSLSAADGKEIWKGSSKGNSVQPAAKLAPATRYSWSVGVDGKSLGEALFETMPADAIARAEKSRLAAKTFPERVVHALVLQDLGANQDAREAWAALARERPDLPELAVLAK